MNIKPYETFLCRYDTWDCFTYITYWYFDEDYDIWNVLPGTMLQTPCREFPAAILHMVKGPFRAQYYWLISDAKDYFETLEVLECL